MLYVEKNRATFLFGKENKSSFYFPFNTIIIITHQSNQKTTTTTRAITISFLNFRYNIPSVSFKSMYISFSIILSEKWFEEHFLSIIIRKKRITLHCYHHTHTIDYCTAIIKIIIILTIYPLLLLLSTFIRGGGGKW